MRRGADFSLRGPKDTAHAQTKVRATVKAEGEFNGERKAFISMLERDPVFRHGARPDPRAKQEAGRGTTSRDGRRSNRRGDPERPSHDQQTAPDADDWQTRR